MSSNKQHVYLLGGSYDLTKLVVEERLQQRGMIEMCKQEESHHVLRYSYADHPVPEEVVATIERYVYHSRLPNGMLIFRCENG